MNLLKAVKNLFTGNVTRFKVGWQYPDPDTYAYSASRSVTADSSLQLSTAYACVRLLSETVGSLPLKVYEKRGDERTEVDNDLSNVLRYQPNPMMDSQVFRETMMINLAMHGNAYARIGRAAGGQPVALWPLAAPQMRVKLQDNGSTVTYTYTESTKEITFRQSDILHIKLPGNGLVGMSPLSYARNSFALAMSTEDLASKYFVKGGKATGTLEMPTWLTEEQREQLRSEDGLLAKISGSDAMGTVLLEGGIRYNPIQFNPDDLQMLDSRKFSVEDIARWFGVPLVMIGHTEKTTSWGTGVEQIMLGFYKTTLRPYLERWEMAMTTQLLAPQDRARTIIEFDFQNLLRGDAKGQAEYLAILAQNGFITRNEGRRELQRPPMDGGDDLTIQVNMTPADLLGANSNA